LTYRAHKRRHALSKRNFKKIRKL